MIKKEEDSLFSFGNAGDYRKELQARMSPLQLIIQLMRGSHNQLVGIKNYLRLCHEKEVQR